MKADGCLRTACDYVHLNPARAGLLKAEDRRLAWTETELAGRRKSDPAKLAMAARPRKETTLSLKAIASRVHLGAAKGAITNGHKWMRASANEDCAQGRLGVKGRVSMS